VKEIGLVLFHVIPVKAGIQWFHGVRNTLDPGFHLPARSRFGEGRQGRRIQYVFSHPPSREGELFILIFHGR
jgi:hypothetical protein